jgi:hypothetical protein
MLTVRLTSLPKPFILQLIVCMLLLETGLISIRFDQNIKQSLPLVASGCPLLVDLRAHFKPST